MRFLDSFCKDAYSGITIDGFAQAGVHEDTRVVYEEVKTGKE
jgi:hypothetical protein